MDRKKLEELNRDIAVKTAYSLFRIGGYEEEQVEDLIFNLLDSATERGYEIGFQSGLYTAMSEG